MIDSHQYCIQSKREMVELFCNSIYTELCLKNIANKSPHKVMTSLCVETWVHENVLFFCSANSHIDHISPSDSVR